MWINSSGLPESWFSRATDLPNRHLCSPCGIRQNPVPGTIGPAFPGTEVKIVGEDGSTLAPGEVGVLYGRGPQIMKGYYKKPDLTAQAIDSEGFLNTGDLAKMTYDGLIKIVGRAKDTVVLLGGENIEPAPIEERLKLSPYIATAVVVGQDKKFLSALILIDEDNVKSWAAENNVAYADDSRLCSPATSFMLCCPKKSQR